MFEAAPPDIHKLPKAEWIGTTVVLLQCSYRDQLFFRVGYFVMNDYTGGELIEAPESIAARRDRQGKARTKLLTALNNGEGWPDFEDFVRERERERERESLAHGDNDENDENDDKDDFDEDDSGAEDAESGEEEEVDDLIVEDDEEDGEKDEEDEEDEDEEDEEDSDDERAPGGKRPPAGKQPPVSVVQAAAAASGDASSYASTTANATTGSSFSTAAADTVQNPKKRGRDDVTPHSSSTTGNGASDAAAAATNASDEADPTAKRRKLADYAPEIIEDYLGSLIEEGPRWYINVDPNLIQRKILMDDPRVTLFTISWADDDM